MDSQNNILEWNENNNMDSTYFRVNNYPRQKDGYMITEWFVASDNDQKPKNPDTLISKCIEGWRRFEIFGIDCYSSVYFGVYDASNVGTNAFDILEDFRDAWHSWNWSSDYNIVNMALVKKSNHNGAARTGGFFGFVAESVEGFFSINHAKDRIAQHELTHMIGEIPDDTGWWPWNHNWNRCIINYFYLWTGRTVWCETCSNKIYNRIWS